jgi:predicted lipid-binding transport protein (Tim44 family)
MLVPGTLALGVTLSLLVVFGGIGALVNVLIFFTIAQVIGEKRDNEERKRRSSGG